MTAQLHALGIEDMPSLLVIEQQSHALPWSEASFESSMAAKHWMQGVFLPCNASSELRAYAVFAPGLDDWELLNITTAPEQRSLGLAKQLLSAGSNAAASAGAQRVLLEVRPSNAAALAAYASFGFEHIAVRKNYYAASAGVAREDALILSLNLNQYLAKQKSSS